MPSEPKRRLFRLLRRTAKSAQGGRTAEEESALWSAHQRALTGSRDAAEAAQRIATSLAKQRASVDAAQDRARAVGVRAGEIATASRKLVELFERLGLVALNAGLEGARLGEGPGKSLSLVADEVRDHAVRGTDGAREIAVALAETVGELAQVSSQIDRVREASTDATQDAARAASLAVEGERALADMGERMKKATGSDPETARAISQAAEHARALVTALSQISGKAPRGLVVGTLRPMLEPLVRLLDSEGDDTDDGDEGRG
jgi:methyl-accepting chemotaxis protein